MKIEKEKFVDSGINFIYDLDEFPRVCVEKQITREFNEVLELNDPAVLQKRNAYFGVGSTTDYLNKLIKTSAGDVVAGIRHLGGDKKKPFVFIWPSFRVDLVNEISDEIYPFFEIFKPEAYSHWCRPDCNNLIGTILQQRFVGRIDRMIKNDLPLRKPEDYYEWYKSEYAKFHKTKPEYKNRITVNSKESMDKSLDEGLLYFHIQDERKIGLIAGINDVFLGESAIYLNDILISENHRENGYATSLLASFTGILNAKYFICEIDSDNIASIKTAIRSGQKIYSQELFVQF